MRLIDIDAFKEKFKQEHEYDFNLAEARAIRCVFNELEKQATAFDVEKVVGQLTENGQKMSEAKAIRPYAKHSSADHKYYKAISVKKAIEIVRKGGVE